MPGEREGVVTLSESETLRTTFNRAAERYDAARPGYPDELFADIINLSGIPSGGKVLEIGPGTGKATRPLAERGFEIRGIELGEDLAHIARRNLQQFPNVNIDVGPFEVWDMNPGSFDLVLSATAFHWIEQPLGYQKVAQALKPGGAFALFRHHHVQNRPPLAFFDEVQEIYLRERPDTDPNLRLPPEDDVDDEAATITATGLFRDVIIRRYSWEETYVADQYIRLLDTYSDHIAMPDDARYRLYTDIANLIHGQYGGAISKRYLVILHLAFRLDE